MGNGHCEPTSNTTVCISHWANTLRKSMNLAMGNIVEQTGLFNLVMATGQGEKNSEFKTAKKLTLCHILLT